MVRTNYIIPAMVVAGIVESIVWFIMKHDFSPAVHRSMTPDSTIGMVTIAAGVVSYLLVAANAKSKAADGEDTNAKKEKNDGGILLSLFEALMGALIGGWITVVVIIISSIVISD